MRFMFTEMYIEVFTEIFGLELDIKEYWTQSKWEKEGMYKEE